MIGNTRHVVNMANSIVGVSILSMPYCFKESGLLLGVLMVLFSGFVTKKTCMFLVRAATMARHHSYEFLAFHVFGVRGKLAVELCMILFLIGICISFHVVMGDLAPALAAQVFQLHNTPSLRATMLLGIAVLVVLPLCLLRKLDNLASMSACSILFYFFLITVIFWHAFPRLVDGSWYHLATLWRPSGVLQVFPICMLGLSCQSNVFEIYDSVQDPDVPKMRSVVNNALNLCCALYISVGFFGYIAFVDQDMAGNIIMNLPATPLTEGIKLFFTASLAISFPLMIFPCRTSIHSLLYSRGTQGLVGSYMPEARFKGITVGILAVSLVVGILIPNIEFVLGMLGSTMGVIISLVLPCVMFIKVNSKASVERLVAQGIMLMGVLLIVSGTYLNLTHTQTSAARGVEGVPQPVIAVPPALLGEDMLLEKEGGGVAVRHRDPAPAGVVEGLAAAAVEDAATRREPVAPEPPPEDVAAMAPAKAGGERAARQQQAVKEGGAAGDTLHPDAIQKEEKETHREGGGGGGDGGNAAAAAGAGAGARVEYKQQELLKKIEVQHQEQQKILAEQKQILQELKDQKAQQELQDSLRAAAAPQQPAVAAAPQLPNAAPPQLANVVPPQQLVAAAPQLPVAAAPQLPVAGAPQQLVAGAPQLSAGAGAGAAAAAAAPQLPVAGAPQLPAAAPQVLNVVPQQPVAAALQQSIAYQPAAAAPQQPAPAPQQPVAPPQQPVAPQQPGPPQQLVAAPQQPVAAALQQPMAALPQQPVAAVQQPAAAAQQSVAPQQPVPAVQQPVVPQQLVPAAAQQPAVAAQQPVAAVQQPVAAVQQPASVVQQPAAAVQQPVIPQQPVAAVQQPVAPQQLVAAVQQPASVVQQPAAAVQQPVAPQQPAAAVQQPVAAAAQQSGGALVAGVQQGAGAVSAAPAKAVVAPGAAPSKSSTVSQHKGAAPQLPHYPGAHHDEAAAKRGPQAYLEKVSQAAPAKPHRSHKTRHDEERRKRAAGPDPALQADPAGLPPVDLKTAPADPAAAAARLSEAAYESRHLLWGNSRSRRRRRRGGQRGGDEEYWDET